MVLATGVACRRCGGTLEAEDGTQDPASVPNLRLAFPYAEARPVGERDLDPRRGSLLVRNGKCGRRPEIGMDADEGAS
jgi:hypothetical protein